MLNTRQGDAGALRQDAEEVGRRTGPAAPARTPDEPTLGQLAWTVLDYRWTVLGVLATVLAVAAVYLVAAPRVYEASVLVQVDSDPAGARSGFEDLGPLFDAMTPVEAEMQMMRSRRLLEGVVEELDLDVEARPVRFPLFGDALARRYAGEEPAPPRFGLSRFAWGGEAIRIERLDVSERLVGEPLVLTVLEDGRFRIAAEDGTRLADGEVGVQATGSDGERSVAILVEELRARPGTRFALRSLPRVDAIERLDDALHVTDQGRHTGLVKLTMSGRDPERTASVLNALSALYLKQNVERTSAEAAKTLAVLELQLPVLKRNLDRAEVALTRFRLANRTIDLSAEAEAMLERVGEIDRAISEIELRKEDLHRYTPSHPDLPGLDGRLARLRSQRAAVEAEMRVLPDRELRSTRLSRQVRVATELYTLVLHRAEELRIVKSGWVGNARVLEPAAAPHRPATPRPAPVLALALVLGAVGGVVAATARRHLDPGVKHPEEIEAGTGLPVFATIHRSPAQRALSRRADGPRRPLAAVDPSDPAVEELRALRSGVQFSLARAQSAIVAVSGLAPLAGKSFVSANLAHLLASGDGRVLLVDGDLRRGVLHRSFGLEGSPGLSDVASGAAELDAAIRRTDAPSLDVLPAGTPTGMPAELLAGEPFARLVAELGRRYRAVVVDTPPVLSVSDAALVARHAGVTLLVVRAGQHAIQEIDWAVRRLAQSGVRVRGAVLNDVRPSAAWAGRVRRYHYPSIPG